MTLRMDRRRPAAETPGAALVRPAFLYLAAFLGWLVVTLSLTAMTVTLDMTRASDRFKERGENLYNHVLDVVNVNDSILEGFAALLAGMGELDVGRARQYTKQVLDRYPHIYRVEVAERVSREERKRFTEYQRRYSHSGFELRAFDYEGERAWKAVADKPYYYPVVFVEPLTPQSRQLLGLDLDSPAFLRQSLYESAKNGGPAATHPFQLIEGDWAYLMHRPVEPLDGRKTAPKGPVVLPQRYALLVIKARTLLPERLNLDKEIELLLYDHEFDAPDPRGHLVHIIPPRAGVLERALFPSLKFEKSIENRAQPLTLSISEQLGWGQLSWSILGAIWFASLLWFVVLAAYARAHHQMEMRRLESENKLFYLANFDTLTGLSNRSHLMDRMYHAQYHADRYNKRLGVIFLDLDGFKGINDSYGHDVGDEVLKTVAQRLRGAVRRDDTVARLGGDEFVVLIEDVNASGEVLGVLNKLKEAITQPIRVDHRDLTVGASLGSAIYPDDGKELNELLNRADSAMYRDKERRRHARP